MEQPYNVGSTRINATEGVVAILVTTSAAYPEQSLNGPLLRTAAMTLKQPLSLGTLDNHIGSSGIYLMIDSPGLFATDASQLQSTA
jgi:hypothetical protein